VQEFIKANELAIAADEPDGTAADIVVLDDITPRYSMANATPYACLAQLLLQARTAYAGEGHLPVSLLARRAAKLATTRGTMS
jgi:hypothetical protein